MCGGYQERAEAGQRGVQVRLEAPHDIEAATKAPHQDLRLQAHEEVVERAHMKPQVAGDVGAMGHDREISDAGVTLDGEATRRLRRRRVEKEDLVTAPGQLDGVVVLGHHHVAPWLG